MLDLQQISLDRLDNPGNLMQSRLWAYVKHAAGHRPMAFHLHWDRHRDRLLILIQKISEKHSIAYVPWAPTFDIPEDRRGLFLEQLSGELRRYLPEETLFIRYDLPWESPYSEEQELPPDRIRELRMNFGLSDRNLHKAPTNIQPVHTRILDLSKDPDTLFGEMKSKTRYNIRLSRRRGVKVHSVSFERLPEWYRMYKETAARKGISLHDYRNFEELLKADAENSLPHTDIRLLLAEKDHQPLAGMILAIHGDTATYLYGASRTSHRNLMPTYRLQWEAIRLSQENSCTYYDMFGIPPTEDRNHPMHGLYRFKVGFGGYTLQRQGCWDYPFDRDAYQTYAGMEPLGPSYHR